MLNDIIEFEQYLYGGDITPNLGDKAQIKFIVNRVFNFLSGNEQAIETHKKHLQNLKENPPKTPKEILARNNPITKAELKTLQEKYQSTFGYETILNDSLSSISHVKQKLTSFFLKSC